MQGHPEIETERLILRPLAPEHAEALHPIYADPHAMRFWQEPPHASLERTRAMLHGLLAGPERAWVYRARGVDLIGEVALQPWGLRQFELRDCNGYLLRFATPG
jgi:RimJ/RimL family protein N-acetyltransferase